MTTTSAPWLSARWRINKPVRIGVNWGSLDQSLLTRMMDENSKRPEPHAGARSDDGSDDGERAAISEAGRANTDWATTGSFCRRR